MTNRRIKAKQAETLQKKYLSYIKNAIINSSLFKNQMELTTVKPFTKYEDPLGWKDWSPHVEHSVIQLNSQNKKNYYVRYEYKWLALKVHFQDKQLDKLTDIRIQCLDDRVWIYINYKHPFDYITRVNYALLYTSLEKLNLKLVETFNLINANLEDFIENEQETQKINNQYIGNHKKIINNFLVLIKQTPEVLKHIQAFGFSQDKDSNDLILYTLYRPHISNIIKTEDNNVIEEILDNNTKYLWSDYPYLFLQRYNDQFIEKYPHWINYTNFSFRKFKKNVMECYSAHEIRTNSFTLQPFE